MVAVVVVVGGSVVVVVGGSVVVVVGGSVVVVVGGTVVVVAPGSVAIVEPGIAPIVGELTSRSTEDALSEPPLRGGTVIGTSAASTRTSIGDCWVAPPPDEVPSLAGAALSGLALTYCTL